jgi:hypothetical protein
MRRTAVPRTMTPTVIAVVGAHPAMSGASHGILRRCGFVAIEAPSLDSARDLIHRGTPPTFVVTMLRGLIRDTTSDGSGSLSAFLDAIRPIVASDYTFAVTTRTLWDDDVRQCEVMGMHVLLDHRFSFRALARLMIDLQGGNGARCCPVVGQRKL